MMLASPASAQNAAGDQAVEEVIITGSRIRRDGYRAPTPTTVATAEDLLLSDPGTLADGLNQLPQFNGSSQPQNGGVSANGATGSNILSLRDLGTQRNLVLLDGRRFVAATDSGSTDINLLPQNLVQRVEIVTGGASAAYGSDAVAGVINFILDKGYEGWRGNIQTGISTYGDSDRLKADIAHGRSFADGRGHLLFSAEYYDTDDIGPYNTDRDWNKRESGIINHTGAQPRTLLLKDGVRVSAATFGGLITAGPLAGTQFGPGGTPMPFTNGAFRSATFMQGGSGIRNDRNMTAGLERWTAFARASYDLTDNFNGFAELTYSEADTMWEQYTNYCYTSCAATIYNDNAFLPAATKTAMDTAGITNFRLNRIHNEKYIIADNQKDVWRFAIGGEGELDNGWTYDLSLTMGESDTSIGNLWTLHYRNYYASIDSVRDTSGNIVCRTTYLFGLDPGCVPFNPFGEGSPSEEALRFAMQDEWRYLTLEQTVAEASLQGEMFSIEGRPVGFATGIEWRDETSDQTVSANAVPVVDLTGIRGGNQSIAGQQGQFIVGNPLPMAGDYDVTEAFVEVALPLLAERPMIESLDLDLAARYADYSLSGGATTWKASLSYEPNSQVRLRATRSRDIRAPNTAELFLGARQGIGTARHPVTGLTVDVITKTRGNTQLDPEEADTLTYGIVIEPDFLEGFSFSADHYDIEIAGAVSSLGRQETMDECYEKNNQTACANIEIAGSTYRIDLPYLNLDLLEVAGWDFEATYNQAIGPGDLRVRLLANYQYDNIRTTPNGVAENLAGEVGQAGNPEWRGHLSATYNVGRLSLYAQQRYIDGGLYDTAREEGVTINENDVEEIWYTDATATYRFGADEQMQVFFTVNNLFNQDPPFAPQVSGTHQYWTNGGTYDVIGRYYNLGFKYNF
ncbi:MAG: TonB-dependent receptor [Pseudohongiellaceae bacterium]